MRLPNVSCHLQRGSPAYLSLHPPRLSRFLSTSPPPSPPLPPSSPSLSPLPNLIDVLSSRGFLSSTTHPLPLLHTHFSTPRTLYAGFDPTAPSLHTGNLLILSALYWAQYCGHRVIALVGGATALIGDPSGRTAERPPLSDLTLQHNIEGVQQCIQRLLTFAPSNPPPPFPDGPTPPPALLLNNLEWFKGLGLLTFLRETAVHYRIPTLLAKTSIASRLAPPPSASTAASPSPASSLTFTEFSYQLLQGYDFYHLHSHYACTAQLGGNDQWGNITSGLDLIGRRGGGAAYGLTLPLLTTASGAKLGKSAGNAIWLTPHLTSPYDLYQHFLNTADTDAPRYLRLLTRVPLDDIPGEGEGGREAVRMLAREVVRILHGEEGVKEAEERTETLFGGRGGGVEGVKGIMRGRAEVVGKGIVEVMVGAGVVGSRNEGRRLIKEGGCYLHGDRVEDDRRVLREEDVRGGVVVIRTGKKRQHVINVE